jgi:polar amino acid transport system substrate-binding protein
VRTRLIVTGLVAGLAALSVPSRSSDLPEIASRGSLRVIAAEGEQPEIFDFEGDPAKPGLEREMLEGFARLNRLKLEVVPVASFADRIPALLRGDGDVVVGLVDTAEWRRQIDFTAEILPVQHLAVTHETASPVPTLDELRRRRVGVVRGTTAGAEARAAGVPESQLVSFPDVEPMLGALAAGRVGAVVMTVSDFTLAAGRHPALRAGVSLGQVQKAAWGVRRGDDQLRHALDDYIGNLRSGPSWNRLVVVYFGEKALTVLGRGSD